MGAEGDVDGIASAKRFCWKLYVIENCYIDRLSMYKMVVMVVDLWEGAIVVSEDVARWGAHCHFLGVGGYEDESNGVL